MNFRVASW